MKVKKLTLDYTNIFHLEKIIKKKKKFTYQIVNLL